MGEDRMIIETVSGQLLDLDRPTLLDIAIEDIVKGLSRIKRFNGRSSLSVLQHSYATYLYMTKHTDGIPSDRAIGVLLHDAGEAFIGDIITPIKQMCPAVKELEHTLRAMAYQAVGVESFITDPVIDEVDLLAMQVEYKYYVAHEDVATYNQYIYGIDTDLSDSNAQLMAKCLLDASLMDEERLILTVSNILYKHAAEYYKYLSVLGPDASNHVLFTVNDPFICTLRGWQMMWIYATSYLSINRNEELIIHGQIPFPSEELDTHEDLNVELLSEGGGGKMHSIRITYNHDYSMLANASTPAAE